MLAELAERDATGDIARIYEEIRRCCAVPYVSSMQRHLATRPGWLQWVWAALRPAFSSGSAQTAAWGVSDKLEVPTLAPISRDALMVWGVDDPALASIAAACESFVRVSPVNLVLAGLLRRLLRGERPNGDDRGNGEGDTGWAPPPPLPALPGMVDAAALPPAERAVLASLGTSVDGEPFVPGLYRMLARWPGLLAHLATVLRPYLDDAAMRAAQARLAEAIDAEVPAVFAALPALRPLPAEPDHAAIPAVRAALDTYRVTSPQLCVLGRMIRHALPLEGH